MQSDIVISSPVPDTLTVLSPTFIAAVALLVLCGPILAFPDLVPPTWRTSVVTLLTLMALSLALVVLQRWKSIRWGLWIFCGAVVASWTVMPVHDVLAVRHFAGIGVGVLAMAVVGTWCTSTDRLVTVSVLFAVASTAILSLGIIGTHLIRTKSIIDSTQPFPAPSNVFNPDAYLYPWLPNFELKLPGLEGNGGWVNPNALGGTALMFLPTCCGLVAAALIAPRRRYLILMIGGVATIVAGTVLGMVQSRSALLAGALTVVVLSLLWRQGRWWALLALFLAVAGLVYLADRSRAEAPANFAIGMERARINVRARVVIWQEGIDRLLKAPWLGIGINQFHEIAGPKSADDLTHVSHAHNTLLQVALDVGLLGLAGYLLLIATLLLEATRAAGSSGVAARIASGAGLSIVAVHFFGLGDAIALGAKVGFFQWACAGLILAASHAPSVPRQAAQQAGGDHI